jgi:hypothetical protein
MPAVAMVILMLLFMLLRPLHIDSGSGQLGGDLLTVLGSIGCIGGLIIVMYFLLRPDPWETE